MWIYIYISIYLYYIYIILIAQWINVVFEHIVEVTHISVRLQMILIHEVIMHLQHAQMFAECITTQNTMNKLLLFRLSMLWFCQHSALALLSGLQKNKSLKSLCLAACRLGNQGIALLCIHRASWKFLEGFRLRDSLHNYRIVEHCWTFTYFNQFRRKCCWHTSKHWAPGWWDGCVSFSHLVAEN